MNLHVNEDLLPLEVSLSQQQTRGGGKSSVKSRIGSRGRPEHDIGAVGRSNHPPTAEKRLDYPSLQNPRRRRRRLTLAKGQMSVTSDGS